MRVREMKALKVGDKVKLKLGDVEEMREHGINVGLVKRAIEGNPIVLVTEEFSTDGTVRIYHKLLGHYYFTKTWLEVYKPDAEIGSLAYAGVKAIEVTAEEPHPLAEVLTWVAQGKQVEYRLTYSQDWKLLDTSKHFSFFADFEYRPYTKPEEPEYYWAYINPDFTCSVSSLMTEQEAEKLFGIYKQKITL